jgi:hypothetical protein
MVVSGHFEKNYFESVAASEPPAKFSSPPLRIVSGNPDGPVQRVRVISGKAGISLRIPRKYERVIESSDPNLAADL